jgi:hypothetical protein
MRLLTTADLNQPTEVLQPLIERAQSLSRIYFDFVEKDPGGHEYKVQIGREDKRSGGIHASELSGCFRKIVYSVNGTERKVNQGGRARDTNMLLRFRLGHAVHALLQNDFERMADKTNGYLTFTPEAKIHPDMSEVAEELDIHSSTDGIFTFHERGQSGWEPILRVGLEIKTASDKSYSDLKKPYDENIDQTMLYMACLDVPLMWMLYYNKSNSNLTTPYDPWLLKFDQKRWDRLMMRSVKAHHLATIGQLPLKEEGMECRWCPFSWECQPDYIKNKTRGGTSPGMRRTP